MNLEDNSTCAQFLILLAERFILFLDALGFGTLFVKRCRPVLPIKCSPALKDGIREAHAIQKDNRELLAHLSHLARLLAPGLQLCVPPPSVADTRLDHLGSFWRCTSQRTDHEKVHPDPSRRDAEKCIEERTVSSMQSKNHKAHQHPCEPLVLSLQVLLHLHCSLDLDIGR